MRVTTAPTQWKRPRPDFLTRGADWGATAEVLVSKRIEEGLCQELWFVPGHKGWATLMDTSHYYPASLVLILVEGATPESGHGRHSGTSIALGGRLAEMLQQPNVAEQIKQAFGAILDSIGRRTTLLIDHEGTQDGRELED